MLEKEEMSDTNRPIWFNGKTINEALFCEEFLCEHGVLFANGAFFTPEGRMTDDLMLQAKIYDKLKDCAVSGIPPGRSATFWRC